jgi:hypothetical protein
MIRGGCTTIATCTMFQRTKHELNTWRRPVKVLTATACVSYVRIPIGSYSLTPRRRGDDHSDAEEAGLEQIKWPCPRIPVALAGGRRRGADKASGRTEEERRVVRTAAWTPFLLYVGSRVDQDKTKWIRLRPLHMKSKSKRHSLRFYLAYFSGLGSSKFGRNN